jgi:SAM-dependent methyltransferase
MALWEVGDRLFRTTDERFQMRRCGGCAVLFLWPTPSVDATARYYPKGYWTGAGRRGGTLRARLIEVYRRAVLRDHVRFVKRVATQQARRGMPVRLLDIACGDGSILAAVPVRARVGIDSSDSAVRAARLRGLDVLRGNVLELPFAAGTFSLVTMFHFLEHVAPPDGYLDAAHRLLADDGDLIVQVPNASSWQAGLLRGRWSGFDVPRHVVNYSVETLGRTLERHGFRVVHATQFSLRDNTALCASSVVPGLYPPARAGRGPEPRALAWLADLTYLAVTLALLPFTFVESAAGRGATIMVHAHRSRS